MFLLRMSKHYHIIQVDDICQVKLPQGVLHEVLESHWRVAEPKGHMSKLVKPQIAHSERGVLLRAWHHPDLPESAFEIHHGEMCSAHHTLQCLLDLWQRVGIFLCMHIESVQIHAEAQRTIFFSYQYHHVAPQRLAGTYCPCIQHIME